MGWWTKAEVSSKAGHSGSAFVHGTAADRAYRRNNQRAKVMAAAKAYRGKDHVIVDTEAHPNGAELEALVKECDLLVLPSTPDALALEALLATVNNLQGVWST